MKFLAIIVFTFDVLRIAEVLGNHRKLLTTSIIEETATELPRTTSCEVIKCEQDRYYFDLDSCECIPEAPCSITCNKGDILDEVACRCDIADVFCFDTKCEDNYDIDFDNCKCIPKPIPSPPCTITCKMGDFLDEVACQCLNIGPCFGKICENDRYLDLDSCQCVRYPSQANKCLKLQKLKI